MGSPDHAEISRPPSVPEDARWDTEHAGYEWQQGALDDAGKKHGPYRSWTQDGVLHGECAYVHGTLHGSNKNFHPDGTLSSDGDWRDGVLFDCVYHRCATSSPEPWPADAGPNVTSVRYESSDGKANRTIRYFADDVEVAANGGALPPRPATVTGTARWFGDLGRWVDGAIQRGTNHQVGPWRWWDGDGVLRHEEVRDDQGAATAVITYEADGTVARKTMKLPEGGEDDEWFREGKRTALYRKDTQGRRFHEAHWAGTTGVLREETTKVWDAAGLASVTERGEDGVLSFEARREGPAIACMMYGSDGKTIAATGLLQDGTLHGVWRLFDDAGALRRELETTPFAIAQKPTREGLVYRLGRAAYLTDEPTLATPEQLAGVDGEPWATTAGCYSDHVKDFPRLLRAVAAPDPMVRAYALGVIDGEVEHQGSTYPATARVIPWLAKLLTHPSVSRSSVLQMIQAAGSNAKPYVDEVAELDEDDDNRIGIEGTYRAVGAAWPAVWSLFSTASAEDRQRILVIAKFAPEAKADLRALAGTADDPALRACAIDSITDMDYDLAEVATYLADPDPLVRAATAIAIGCTRGPESPPEVARVLAESLRGWNELAGPWARLPYADSHLLAYLALAAGSIRSAEVFELAAPLCASIDEVDGMSAASYGQGLCALALGRGDRPFAPAFLEILEALQRSKRFWTFNVNAAEILRKWALPASPEPLAALIAELRASSDPEARLHAVMHADDDEEDDADDAGDDDDSAGATAEDSGDADDSAGATAEDSDDA